MTPPHSASKTASGCWSTPSGPPASSGRCSGGSGRRSCAIPPHWRLSTSPTPAGSTASRSCRWAAAAWIAERHNLLITGPTGIGKSFLACAFVERACRRGFTARYVRMPRVLHEVAVGRGDGSYTRLLARLAKLDLLAIDDWLLAPLRDAERRDLTEIIEDRAERASTLIASQLPATDWHTGIGDPNQADAICDRLLHDAHRLELQGPSMRRTKASPKLPPKATP